MIDMEVEEELSDDEGCRACRGIHVFPCRMEWARATSLTFHTGHGAQRVWPVGRGAALTGRGKDRRESERLWPSWLDEAGVPTRSPLMSPHAKERLGRRARQYWQGASLGFRRGGGARSAEDVNVQWVAAPLVGEGVVTHRGVHGTCLYCDVARSASCPGGDGQTGGKLAHCSADGRSKRWALAPRHVNSTGSRRHAAGRADILQSGALTFFDPRIGVTGVCLRNVLHTGSVHAELLCCDHFARPCCAEFEKLALRGQQGRVKAPSSQRICRFPMYRRDHTTNGCMVCCKVPRIGRARDADSRNVQHIYPVIIMKGLIDLELAARCSGTTLNPQTFSSLCPRRYGEHRMRSVVGLFCFWGRRRSSGASGSAASSASIAHGWPAAFIHPGLERKWSVEGRPRRTSRSGLAAFRWRRSDGGRRRSSGVVLAPSRLEHIKTHCMAHHVGPRRCVQAEYHGVLRGAGPVETLLLRRRRELEQRFRWHHEGWQRRERRAARHVRPRRRSSGDELEGEIRSFPLESRGQEKEA